MKAIFSIARRMVRSKSKMNAILILVFLFYILHLSISEADNSALLNADPLFDNNSKGQQQSNNFLLSDSILFVSTFDGYLSAVNQKNGEIMWTIKEEPVLKMSMTDDRGTVFIANPIDGSLYSFRVGNEGFKKLPFSIPDLVSISPSRGDDGALYTGHKKDTWFSVDLLTGSKHHILDSQGIHEICPSTTHTTIFIGRTEFSVNLFDKKSGKISWNATFAHYTSHLSLDTSNFGLKHFASTSNGFVITMDAETGRIAWTRQFDSPIVGIYSVDSDGAFISRPFHSMGLETLAHLSEKGLVGSEWADKFSLAERFKDSFLGTLYIGRHGLSTYALPSFVDSSLVSISPKSFGRPLLEGPRLGFEGIGSENNCKVFPAGENVQRKERTSEAFLIGHHEMPDTLTEWNVDRLPLKMLEDKSHPMGTKHDGKDTRESSYFNDSSFKQAPPPLYDRMMQLIFGSALAIIVTLLVMLVFQKNQEVRLAMLAVPNQMNSAANPKDGIFQVGKISYNEEKILGRGCHGTVVFRGQFEGRDVAVKRVLSNFMDVANREVDLLKMSDDHQNVVRYFCMEEDHQFNYIALELCPATLHDLVEKKVNSPDIHDLDLKDVLLQMLSGISHLHSLNIVHRDIKPHNVLLSDRNERGRIRVMISDFGFCRRLSHEKASFSRTSGIFGTDGWTAPEALDSNGAKATRAVDVFSSGLVLFYVLSFGSHPFGEFLNRQNNIVNGSYDMKALQIWGDSFAARDIIEKMICSVPSDRPSVEFALKHPALWNSDKQLKFLEAVSDRLEKVDESDEILLQLNKQPNCVVKKDWTKNIHSEFLIDTKKFRSYKGNNVRDLIRFIRNKRHHYHELPLNLKSVVGSVPDGFVSYFVKKFPPLILHAHRTLECLRDESSLTSFY